MTVVGVAVRWLHLASGLGLVGLFTVMLLAGRSDRPTARGWDVRVLRWARRLLVALLLSGVATLAHQTAVVTGRPGAALEPAAWLRLLGQSHFGTVWLVRHGLVLLLAALVFLRERERSRADWLLFRGESGLLAGAGAAAMAWAGHAAAVEPGGLPAALLDALHVLTAGAWLGALLPLAWLLRAASTESGADARPYAVLAARRFSALALVAVLGVIATGLANTWYQVGGVPALVGTSYGRLLLLKVALLIAALIFARANRRLLPRLAGDGVTVGRPAMAQLARFLDRECALAVLILGITAALSLSPPALHDSPSWPFAHRFSYEVAAGLPGGRTRMLIGSQLALLGVLGGVIAGFARGRRGLLAGVSAAALAIGLWVALPPMAVDAYPTTYLRPSVPYQASSIVAGAALYRTHCAICHGVGGVGDGPGGAGLPRPPADLTAPHTAQHTAGDIFWWLTHGIPASGMPAFGTALSVEDRWDLINFLRALSAGEQARRLGPLVEPDRPWLVAPDFSIAVGPAPARTLKEFRDRWMVLLVFFSLPESRPRLVQLAHAYSTIQALGTEIVGIPMGDRDAILRRLGARPPILFPVLTDGAEDVVGAYRLFSRTPGVSRAGTRAPATPHAEFLVDRQGYIRARFIPGDGGKGWDVLETLIDEIQIIDREKPAGPPPEEHVH